MRESIFGLSKLSDTCPGKGESWMLTVVSMFKGEEMYTEQKRKNAK